MYPLLKYAFAFSIIIMSIRMLQCRMYTPSPSLLYAFYRSKHVLLHDKRYGPETLPSSWSQCMHVSQQQPVTLLLHGLLGNGGNFRTIGMSLSDDDNTVITLDARNHGVSPHTSTMNLTEMVSDVIATMDHLHISTANVVGHSMGGKVAAAMALLYPERVTRLAVVDIAPISYGVSTNNIVTDVVTAMHAITPRLSKATSRKEVDLWLKDDIVDRFVRQFVLQNLHEASDGNGFLWRCNVTTIYESLKDLSMFPFDDGKRCYNGPALFVVGEQSPYVQQEHLPTIERLFPTTKISASEAVTAAAAAQIELKGVNDDIRARCTAVIPAVGHFVHSENPKTFISTLLTFLRREKDEDH